MNNIPDQLKKASEEINEGMTPRVTVRTLLSWFGAYRRSWRNAELIDAALDELNLFTDPDYKSAWIDEQIEIKSNTTGVTISDPTYRVSQLVPEGQNLVFVKPQTSISAALTKMSFHDYSQLPVMPSEYNVQGVFCWKSVVEKGLLNGGIIPDSSVDDYLVSFKELRASDSIFDAVEIVTKNDCVLVKGDQGKYIGIITVSDLANRFSNLGEPYIYLGEIENQLRILIRGKFSREELCEAKDSKDENREISGPSSLTFGEYIRLLENQSNWSKLELHVDRKTFIAVLHDLREIRNNVMHFNPDGIEPKDIATMRQMTKLLRKLRNK